MNAESKAPLYPKVSHLINTVLGLEKGRVFKVQGRQIFPSEVHLLLEVAAQPEITATELATNLAVTKGAVSQTISRLEGKGLLIKSRQATPGSALRLDFTPAGQETVEHFRKKTAGLKRGVEAHLAQLSPAQRRVVGEFLDCLTAHLEDLGQP